MAAAAQAGIRITLLDTCYLTSGVDGAALTGPQRRFGDGDAQRWAQRAADFTPYGAHARVGAAVHSVRAVPAGQLPVVADWAAERAAPLHLHLSEQPAENEACRAAYGRTPTALLADAGLLGPRTTAVHATHLTGADVRLLGGSGTGVCFCPTTERDLADGIGPAPELAAAGSPLSLGSDSHAVIDPFEEARALERQRGPSPVRVPEVSKRRPAMVRSNSRTQAAPSVQSAEASTWNFPFSLMFVKVTPICCTWS